MALTPEEKQIAEYGKKNGKSKEQVLAALARHRQSQPPAEEGYSFKEFGGDIKDTFQNVGKALYETTDKINAANPGGSFRGLAQATGIAAGGLSKAFGETIMGAGKATLPQNAETAIGNTAQAVISPVVQGIAETEPVKNLIARYQALDENKKRDIDAVLGMGSLLSEFIGGGTAKKLFTTSVDTAIDVASRSKSLFPTNRIFKSAEEVIDAADNNLPSTIPEGSALPSQSRALAEQGAPKLTLKEKWAGIRPDIKKRIQGKPELVQEYFDVTHARNLDDKLPTVYEHGGNYARKAEEVMSTKLSETGGDIGRTRQKLGSYEAPQPAVVKIESTFNNELSKLNLEVKNGVIRQKPGTVTKVSGSGDIKTLQTLHDDLLAVKQSPKLTNLIDLRSAFDNRINFGKSAREVSNSVDPLSRQMRKEIADTAAGIVGKSEAGKLAQYSDFMDAYNDIKSFTDRKAGGEYLLRLMMSGRGGEARKISNTILEHTGIDLMDHATMMEIANEVVGNEAQKNLFRQEMTKAGLDVAGILRGDPSGAVATLIQKGLDKVLDREQIFIDASRR